MVIYGGWIFGGMVFGYDKVKELNLKNVIVFGVGMTVPSEEVAAKIAEQNQIPRDRFYCWWSLHQNDSTNPCTADWPGIFYESRRYGRAKCTGCECGMGGTRRVRP